MLDLQDTEYSKYRLNSKEESLISMWLALGKTRETIVLINLLSLLHILFGKT